MLTSRAEVRLPSLLSHTEEPVWGQGSLAQACYDLTSAGSEQGELGVYLNTVWPVPSLQTLFSEGHQHMICSEDQYPRQVLTKLLLQFLYSSMTVGRCE